VRGDLQEAVRAQQIAGDSNAVERLRGQLNSPIYRELRDILGNDGFEAFRSYETSSYFRVTYVEPLAARFAAANVPLAEGQMAQLASIVAANHHAERTGKSDLSKQSRIDWQAVLSQAHGLLNLAQLGVLEAEIAATAPASKKKG
jgi:hypothetical protein